MPDDPALSRRLLRKPVVAMVNIVTCAVTGAFFLAGVLALTDGTVVRCVGLQPGNLERLSASDRFVETLNAAIRAHQGRSGAS
jgi:hypothetical protein